MPARPGPTRQRRSGRAWRRRRSRSRSAEETRDLAAPLADGERIEIVTAKSDGALDLIRHDAAHVMATAVCELWPGTRVSIGPPIENGFYYDFEFPEGVTISDADLEAIEAKMAEHIAADEDFERTDIPVAEAIERFRGEDQPYKVELIEDLIRDRRDVETVSLYRNGPFTDLCRGPHAPSTGRIKAIKLNSVAGAYWRGDETRQMLTRIYGTAFFTKSDLAEHLERIEQARARDHRRLGPRARPVHLPRGGARHALLAAQGTVLLRLIRERVDAQLGKRGYVEIRTPEVLDVELWHRSGHYDNYRENMYFAEPAERDRGGERQLRAEADELPRRLPGVRLRAPLLPRPAAAPRRVRQRLALRARGGPPRAAPGPRLHPGRRPRLLHARADRGRGGRHLRGDRRALRRVRLRRRHASSSRPGPRSRSAPTRHWEPAEAALTAALERIGSRLRRSIPATAPSTDRRSTST